MTGPGQPPRAIPAAVLSTAFVDGLVLAAIALPGEDDGAEPALAPGLARALARRRAELSALSRAARHQVLRDIVHGLDKIPAHANLPPRLRSLLGRRDAGAAGEPDRVRMPRSLQVLLRRIAFDLADFAGEERTVGARLDGSESAPASRERAAPESEGACGGSMVGVEHDAADGANTAVQRRVARELALVREAPWR